MGCLGGSEGYVSDFTSSHDLVVPELEPHIGLYADSSGPGACFRFGASVSFSAPSPLTLSKMSKH